MVDNSGSQRNCELQPFLSNSQYPSFGFNVDGIETINPRFRCIFCPFIINDPIQLACGHRACRKCFEVRVADSANRNVQCPNEDCREITNLDEIMPDRAFKRELNILKIVCVYKKENGCIWTGPLQDYQAHLDEIHVRHICPHCNENFTSETVLNEHITRLCPMIFHPCPLAPFCGEHTIPKTDFSSHLLCQEHQDAVNKFLLGEYHFQDRSNQEQYMESITMNKELEKKISVDIDNLSKKIQTLTNETAQLTSDCAASRERLNGLAQEINNLRLTLNQRLPIKESIQPSHEKTQKDIETLQQKCDSMELTSMDGILTWRVDRVSEKIADAQAERQTSISSPTFYSSPTGYKMRVRLFLFGDGSARRTHVSLFFALLKGDFDAILKWPFSYKVTFCLLDQSGNNRHIIDSFYPDVKSSSFQRPRDEANIASGIPKFFPLPMLLQDDNGYSRDDAIYIKVIVALNETPKTALPFMLTLNPALPTYVQENLVNQEMAKRQQQAAASDISPMT